MLDPIALRKVDGYCKASPSLMRGSDAADRDDRAVVFAGGERLTHALLESFCHAAAATDVDIVYLEFGRRVGPGPRRVQIIRPQEGKCYITSDCAFWAPDDDGPMVLVPVSEHASHFALTPDGVVHRPGKVAPSLTRGIKRAARRLKEATRELEGNRRSDSVWIHA